MAEISNGTLALLVLVALAVVVTTTTLQLNGGLTGYSVDSGDVQLSIASNLQIEVTNTTIDFGACTPNSTAAYTDHTNDTTDDTNGQCTGGTADLTQTQHIRVANIGNTDANVEVRAACVPSSASAASFIPSPTSGGAFEVSAYSDNPGDCSGLGIGSWTSLSTTDINVCTSLQNTTGAFLMPARVTIPTDAQQGGTCTTNTITFTGS